MALALVAGLFSGAAVAADGLAVPAPESAWPTWRARLTLTAPRGEGLALAPAAPVRQAELLGDWYLDGGSPVRPNQWQGGLRATGGLVLGRLGYAGSVSAAPFSVSLLSAPDAEGFGGGGGLRPYLGFGYAGRSAGGAFSVNADLGLVADQPGALFGSQGLNDAVRRLDLSPMFRLGVNYAF
ncbi:MAG: hypothetical protein OEU93_07355 [Rubrivivax sp.]|nr:hypothetical protein [Rubrivivax sp.]